MDHGRHKLLSFQVALTHVKFAAQVHGRLIHAQDAELTSQVAATQFAVAHLIAHAASVFGSQLAKPSKLHALDTAQRQFANKFLQAALALYASQSQRQLTTVTVAGFASSVQSKLTTQYATG